MDERVGVGIIGCGAVARQRLKGPYPELHDLAEVVATCDPLRERAETLATDSRQLGADCQVYTDLGALLADPRVQAVDICTPHPAHAEPTIAAAEAGKHVLVEKPIATTLADGRRMVAAARAAGLVLCVNEQLRVQEPVIRAREMIAAGEVGTVAVARAHRIGYLGGVWMASGWRHDASKAGGGMLLDQGPHYFNMLRTLVGPVAGEVTHVAARATTVREDWRAEDTAVVILQFESGLLAEALYCWATRTPELGAVGSVYGARGSLDVMPADAGLVLHRPDLPGGRRVIIEADGYDSGVRVSVEDFLRAVRGERAASATGEEGLRDLAVIVACYHSLKSGQFERVETV